MLAVGKYKDTGKFFDRKRLKSSVLLKFSRFAKFLAVSAVG